MRLVALGAAVAIAALSACGAAPPPVRCAGQPIKVTAMPTYVLEQCEDGKVLTIAAPRQYGSTADAMHDPFFWAWMMGPRYHSYPVYSHYVSSPVYRSYVVRSSSASRSTVSRSTSSYRTYRSSSSSSSRGRR